MADRLIFLSVPGLRRRDLPRLTALGAAGGSGQLTELRHSFPAVTWPAQATMLCGCLPAEHGVVANGFYWRDESRVEMWTAWNRVIERPQVWDRLRQQNPGLVTAAWFPMLAKGCSADVVCMPAPIHRPDGSEELWCHTRPQEFYGDLLREQGHFPLQHFWGPLAGIQSSQWIARAALAAADRFAPQFWYIYLPHLDYAAQKHGPDSPQAEIAVGELNEVLQLLVSGLRGLHEGDRLAWMVASEYVISPVDHVSFPNRILREEGWLQVVQGETGEEIDLASSAAWALVDHQFSHLFVRDRDPELVRRIARRFESVEGIAAVWDAERQREQGVAHPRSGDLVLVSGPRSWQAYYWWMDDAWAPAFARTVDIHRKPGYDPVELFFDPATRSIPLDAGLVRGSHGLTGPEQDAESVLWATGIGDLPPSIADTEVADIILRHFRGR